MTYYKFVRPQKALKFGTTLRTPATDYDRTGDVIGIQQHLPEEARFILIEYICGKRNHVGLDV